MISDWEKIALGVIAVAGMYPIIKTFWNFRAWHKEAAENSTSECDGHVQRR